MATEAGRENFKSPLRKLVAFFKRSRDKWKLKMASAKKDLKRLENRVRFLQKSREQWKEKARDLEAQNASLKAELRKRSAESEPQVVMAAQKKASPQRSN